MRILRRVTMREVQNVRYAPGTTVWLRNQRWRVDHARQDRDVVRVDVSNHTRRFTVLAPFDRPVRCDGARRMTRVRRQHAIGRIAGVIARTHSMRSLVCGPAARVTLLAHQLEPALAVLDGTRRLLLADEVGLGKTIQAGFVMAELMQRRPACRMLVITPTGLRSQWAAELHDRFAIDVVIADRHGLTARTARDRRGADPWAGAGVWLTSPDYLKQPHVRDAMPATLWDVVVIDEAHDAAGDSTRHDVCHAMAQQARHVLLLTATPHSGDAARFARLMDLGALPALDAPIAIFRRTRAALGMTRTRRVRRTLVRLSPAEHAVLDVLARFERAVIAAAGVARRSSAFLLLAVLRKRALSTMAALEMSLARRLLWVTAQTTPALDWRQPRLWTGDEQNDDDADERAGLMAETGLSAGLERRWLSRLQSLARAAMRCDSRIARLRAVLARTDEPVVVFTEFRHSLDAIARALSASHRIAALHGGMTASERARALDAFIDGAASVLIATDVAGQGLNLHSRARWVINVELPWNPTRLEQRVGRVDRIGQRKPVHVSLLVVRHAAEAAVLSRLAHRALVARHALGDNNVFDDALPSELAVSSAVLTSTEVVDDVNIDRPMAVEPASTKWRRRARAVARDIGWRAHMARRWRAPRDVVHRVAGAVIPRRLIGRARPAGPMMVIAVPLLDESGLVLERRALVVRVPAGAADQALRFSKSAEFTLLIAHTLERRRRRLQQLSSQVHARAAEIERAIAEVIEARVQAALAAPTLFQSAYVAHTPADGAAAARPVPSAVCIGQPTVELVLTDRAGH